MLTKKGVVLKKQPLPHKDETGHFYIAQLIHYGLSVVKTKNAAKNRLMAAIGTEKDGKSLKIPLNILKLEKAAVVRESIETEGREFGSS